VAGTWDWFYDAVGTHHIPMHHTDVMGQLPCNDIMGKPTCNDVMGLLPCGEVMGQFSCGRGHTPACQ
jgi:hypothetical protein